MRVTFLVLLIALSWPAVGLHAQTPEDITKLIQRVVELDSIDLSKDVKHRAGLLPALFELEADESGMKSLRDPFQVFGQNQAGAAGWYRVTFTVPERIGKFPMPKNGYNLGIETNVLGSWETYTYYNSNGKPAGMWSVDGMKRASDQHATVWQSNAPMPAKPGDKITHVILAMSSPLGRGSKEGYALRHLRLRFALSHTGGRQPFFGSVPAPGQGTGLFGARERLATAKGEELSRLQEKLKGPLERTEALFKAAETGQLDALTKAMIESSKEINEALKK